MSNIASIPTPINILAKLLGCRVWAPNLASAMLTIQFGQKRIRTNRFNRSGQTVEVGEFALHIQCAWRVMQDDELLYGKEDVTFADSETDYDPLFRQFQSTFSNPPTVKNIQVTRGNGFIIELDNRVSIEAFPCSASSDEYNEYWRVLEFDSGVHSVVSRNTITNA